MARHAMRILIVTPGIGDVPTGNVTAAAAWEAQLRPLGHDVRIAHEYAGEDAAVLIALHGEKSHASVSAFRRDHPQRPIIVVATGTDIYPRAGDAALESFALADRIVVLQSGARDRIPAEHRDKTWVIVQSAEIAPERNGTTDSGTFDICVIGHLRDPKDPMRAAAASRLLPAESRIRVHHAGAVLDRAYEAQIEREQAQNDRYSWLGSLTPSQALRLVADSRLLVVSSFQEGGSRVLGEAVANGTPVLAARSDAALSLLGPDYPGLYDAGDTRQLADLMSRAETDSAFLAQLSERITLAADQFDPRLEREAWRRLIGSLDDD